MRKLVSLHRLRTNQTSLICEYRRSQVSIGLNNIELLLSEI